MSQKPTSGLPPWGMIPTSAAWLVRDLPVMIAGLALFYGVLSLAHYWASPVTGQQAIDLHPGALPKYAFFSVARITIAYFISLVFTLVYAYIAAHNSRAERIMIPLLDTLQSIPVLSFLPTVMIAMVALFPSRQLGVELGSIVLIFTGQVWNMAFSVYSSMKSIPREMLEASRGLPPQLVAEICSTGAAVFRHRPHLEFHNVGGRRVVLPDGLRNVCAGKPRSPSARPGLLFAVRLERRRHARHRLGPSGNDRRHRIDGPANLASHHRLEREIQI